MNKQEQIEEMANYYCEYCKKQTGNKFCEHIDDKSCNIFFEAELFYNAGYRKIPENAVVLTKEEYIDLSRNYVGEQIEQARKKAVKEILSKLNALMEQYHYKSTAWRNCANFIKETYGVEVEE